MDNTNCSSFRFVATCEWKTHVFPFFFKFEIQNGYTVVFPCVTASRSLYKYCLIFCKVLPDVVFFFRCVFGRAFVGIVDWLWWEGRSATQHFLQVVQPSSARPWSGSCFHWGCADQMVRDRRSVTVKSWDKMQCSFCSYLLTLTSESANQRRTTWTCFGGGLQTQWWKRSASFLYRIRLT